MPAMCQKGFFKWAVPILFLIYFRLFKQTLQIYDEWMWKMSIQYAMLRFEPTDENGESKAAKPRKMKKNRMEMKKKKLAQQFATQA